jgi:Fe-S-cluster containining protein
VPSQRKQEVFGLLLMAVAFLLALALLSHDARDNHLASSISWVDALLPGPERAFNLLGLVGAKLSHHLVAASSATRSCSSACSALRGDTCSSGSVRPSTCPSSPA